MMLPAFVRKFLVTIIPLFFKGIWTVVIIGVIATLIDSITVGFDTGGFLTLYFLWRKK